MIDLADAIYFLITEIDSDKIYNQGITHINIGTGKDISINELANVIKQIVGYKSEIIFDKSKPDGSMKKLLNVNRIENLGWKYRISINKGVEILYQWFIKNLCNKY